MTKRGIVFLIILIILAMLSLPVHAQESPPALGPGASAIPTTYMAYIELDTTALPKQLAALRRFFGLNTNTTELMQGLIDALLDSGGAVSYADDIRPWLGDHIALGLNDEDNFVLMAAVADPGAASAFLDQLAGAAPRDYRGVIILEASMASGAVQAFALVGDYLAFGDPNGVEAAVDVQQGATDAIAESEALTQAFAQLPLDRFMAVFIDGAALGAFGLDPSPVLDTNMLNGIAFAGSTLPDDPSALRFDLALGFSETVPEMVMSTASVGSTLEQALPADTLGFFTSYDLRLPVRAGLYGAALQSYLTNLLRAADTGAELPEAPTRRELDTLADGLLATANLALVQSGLSINLEADVLDWLSGEYGFGVLPNAGGLWGDARVQGDVFFITQAIDRNATLNIVEVFSRLLDSQLGLTPVQVTIGGYDLRAISDAGTGGNLFVFGLVEDYFVAVTGDGIEQIIDTVQGTAPSLAASTQWQERTRFITPGSESLFYFDAGGVLEFVRGVSSGPVLQDFEASTALLLAPYDYIAAAGDIIESGNLIVLTAVVGQP